MPLIKSASKKAVGTNISREQAAGKPHNQAVAIALSVQDKAKKRKNTIAASYAKHMKSNEETGETKKESKKTEMGEY
jgi:hypothetical protein